ncbi:hypothetical protein PMAYCL1PPCAC_14941, partial [Pristionchus mayeri]
LMAFCTNDPPEEVSAALTQHHPEHEQFEEYVIEGHVDIKLRPLSLFIQAYMILPVIPMCILVFFVRHKVICKLNAKDKVMTYRTKEMHKSLVKVLTLQASLPIFFLLSVISFILVKREILVSPFLEYSMIWYISCMPALSPFITLYNVTPFKKYESII